MDYFLHIKREENEETDIESNLSENSEEITSDIESRLYSIVHHNDLTQPLPQELEALYTVEHTNQGEIIVSLKENTADSFVQKNLGDNLNRILNNCIENEQNFTAINYESNETKQKSIQIESNVMNDNPKFDDIATDGNQNHIQTEPYYSNAKRGRYSDVVKEKDLPVRINNYVNEKDSDSLNSSKDWGKNSKLNFIPIGEKADHQGNENTFEKIFSDIMEFYPHICDTQLRNIISRTLALASKRNKKLVTTKYVLKNNKRFFKKQRKIIHDNVGMKNINLEKTIQKQKKINQTEPIEQNKLDNESCEVLKKTEHTESVEKVNLGIKPSAQIKFNKIICPLIKKWQRRTPNMSLKSISKQLKMAGYKYTVTKLSKLVSSNFPNLVINTFPEKLPSEDVLITNVIQCNRKTQIPVVTIDTSDEELNNKNEYSNLGKRKKDKLNQKVRDYVVRTDWKSDPIDLSKNCNDRKCKTIHSYCPPKKWTRKMIKFYDRVSKRLETFDHQEIKLQLRSNYDPQHWLCYDGDDKYFKKKRYQNNAKVQCTNCLNFGHGAFACKRPSKRKICYMCGMEGHLMYSCPERKCLSCGEFSKSYCSICTKCRDYPFNGKPCEICNSKNHPKELCTDLWRCYHSTTNSGPIVNTTETPNTNKCCPYCSEVGHFAHECTMYFEETVHSQFVKNYSPLKHLIDYRDIMLSPDLYSKFQTSQGEKFLQFLSNELNMRIDIISPSENSTGSSLRCFGTPEQWECVRSQIKKWYLLDSKQKINNRRKK